MPIYNNTPDHGHLNLRLIFRLTCLYETVGCPHASLCIVDVQLRMNLCRKGWWAIKAIPDWSKEGEGAFFVGIVTRDISI